MSVQGVVPESFKELPLEEVETYWEELVHEYGGYFPDKDSPGFLDLLLTNDSGLDWLGIGNGLMRFFFHEVIFNGKLMGTLIILTVFSMILETMHSAFERKTVSKVGYTMTFLVLMIIAINSFSSAIEYAKGALESMIHFMVAMIPLLLTVLASLGNLISVSVMHPLVTFMIHTVSTLVYTVVFPLLFFSALLHIVSAISERYKVTQLANLLRNLGIGILGVLLTVFLGVMTVRGAMGSVADGVTLRTAKYVTGNFVPVVGRLFSDATDTVLGASLLVKNTIGLAGVIIIILISAFPALKILALALIYYLTAAIMQPLGDSPVASCMQTIGKSMLYIFAALASVSLMFFLSITIMITAGNLSVMMR